MLEDWFKAESFTVRLTALLTELPKEGIEKDFVKVYVLPITFVWEPPLIEILEIPTLSLTIAVKVAVLSAELEEEYQIKLELSTKNEEIVGA